MKCNTTSPQFFAKLKPQALVGTDYYFFRILPVVLPLIFRKTELQIFLRTGSRSDTSFLIMVFYAKTRRIWLPEMIFLYCMQTSLESMKMLLIPSEFKMAQELRFEISIVGMACHRDLPKSSWGFDRIKNPCRASMILR